MQSTWNKNSYCAFYKRTFFFPITCVHSMESQLHLVIYFFTMHTYMYWHPYFALYLSLFSCISCGETFQNTPQNDDVTSEKKKTTHLTIWRSMCIIFLFHIFFNFFFRFSFHHFLPFAVVCDDGGNGDVWSIDRMPNMHMHAEYDDIIVKLCIFCAANREKFRYNFYACALFPARVVDLFGNWMCTNKLK